MVAHPKAFPSCKIIGHHQIEYLLDDKPTEKIRAFHLWNRPPFSSFLNRLSKVFFNHLGRFLSWMPLIMQCCFLFNYKKFYISVKLHISLDLFVEVKLLWEWKNN